MSSPSYETLSVLGVGVGGVLNQQPPMRVCRGCPVHSAGSPNPGPPPPLAAAPPRPALELSNLQSPPVRRNKEFASTETAFGCIMQLQESQDSRENKKQ